MKTINYISKYVLSALIFGIVLVSMPLNAISAEMECPLGRTAITMTNDKSGKTRVVCLPDQAVSGIENAADHSAIEISASCPCWSEEDIQAYDAKYSMTCVPHAKDPGTTCHYIDPITNQKTEVVSTVIDNTQHLCIDGIDNEKIGTSNLEFQQCEEQLSAPCPCWTDEDLAHVYSINKFDCSGDAVGDITEFNCYLGGTNTELYRLVSSPDYQVCYNQSNYPKGAIEKQGITDRELVGCANLLKPYDPKQ